MKLISAIEIVTKIVGEVRPTGDSSRDLERLKNLKELCELTNELVALIDDIRTNNHHSHEHSVKLISDYAGNFIDNTLGISNES